MIVKKLILHKFKRYFLNNITTLEYTPKQNMQMIIGSNGSGKTQTLKELNPMPADLKKDFYDGGYKYIEIEHLNKLYTISSGYVAANKHSFILDNVELNQGGTRKVQLELIKEHFNVTPDIIQILLNNDRLTSMSIQDRKKWLSELSTIDYTYAIYVYNKLRARHRDIVGGIKLLQETILKYKNNLISDQELERLTKNKEILDDIYQHIVSLYEHNNSIIQEDVDTKLKTIHSLTNELTKIQEELYQDYNISQDVVFDTSSIEQELNDIELAMKNEIFKSTQLVKQLDDLNKLIAIGDYTVIKKELDEVTTELASLTANMEIPIDPKTSDETLDLFQKLAIDIFSILRDLSELEHIRKYSKDELLRFKQSYDNTLNTIKIRTNRYNLIQDDIKHLLANKSEEHKLTCPKCNHFWYHGYNEDSYLILQKDAANILKELDTLKKNEQQLKSLVDDIHRLELTYETFKNLIKSHLELKPIWSYFLAKVNIYQDTSATIESTINYILSILTKYKPISSLIKRQDKLTLKLKTLEELKHMNQNLNVSKYQALEKELDIVTTNKINLEKTKLDKTKYYAKIKNYIEKYAKLKSSLSSLRTVYKKSTVNIRNKYITELANYIKEEMIKIDQSINVSKQSINKLKEDTKLLEDYKKREKVLNIVVKELSPTEGLIAKSINSFLNVFIKEMNEVINSIWTYEIELLPCDVSEENDLDYKFKVRVNNDEVIEDVSKLSSSMKEIVDLAFRLVFAKYMHLIDIPLYLDEFGSTFDKAHRTAAYNVIDKILCSDYHQVFIICHYESLYSSLRNVDFNILDPNNIEIPLHIKKINSSGVLKIT